MAAADKNSRTLSKIRQRQAAMFREMGTSQQFRFLFDPLPDVYFFAKDVEGRHFCVSQSIVRKLGLRSETEMLGTTDYDRYPRRIADQFRRDDLRVMKTRRPLSNRLEVWYNEHGVLDWCITDKQPIFGRRRQVIGVMGTVRKWKSDRPLLVPYSRIGRVLERIRSDRSGRLSVGKLAREAGMSTRHLTRRFVELFGVSARAFLMKSRMQIAASALLDTDAPIAQIALQSGFCDQSAFTQQFRAHTGTTPLKYRNQARVGRARVKA